MYRLKSIPESLTSVIKEIQEASFKKRKEIREVKNISKKGNVNRR